VIKNFDIRSLDFLFEKKFNSIKFIDFVLNFYLKEHKSYEMFCQTEMGILNSEISLGLFKTLEHTSNKFFEDIEKNLNIILDFVKNTGMIEKIKHKSSLLFSQYEKLRNKLHELKLKAKDFLNYLGFTNDSNIIDEILISLTNNLMKIQKGLSSLQLKAEQNKTSETRKSTIIRTKTSSNEKNKKDNRSYSGFLSKYKLN
jgi:hypothetical protein